MKYLIPKSYRIKHKMLGFLSEERMKNGGLNPVEQYTFSLRYISEKIGEKYEDIYIMSDYLFYKDLLHFKKNESELMNPYCWVLDSGIELYSSFDLMNKGKELNTNLYSNIVSIFSTLILGGITIYSVYTNNTNSTKHKKEINRLEKKIETNESNQLLLTNKILSLENYFLQMKDYQTNIQKNGKN